RPGSPYAISRRRDSERADFANHPARGRRTLRRLIGLLLALDLLALFGLVRPLRLASHYPGPLYSLFEFIGHSRSATIHYTLLTTAMIALFMAAYLVSRDLSGRRITFIVFGGAGLLALTYLMLYPATSSDLFHYVMEARILWVHHDNPFTQAPGLYQSDPFFFDRLGNPQIYWQDIPSPYGPVWILLTAFPLLIGHGDPIWTFIAFKLLAIVFYFVAAVAIFYSVRMLRPGREWGATLLWTWNPLVLMYVAGNGANDVIMMGFALCAVYFGLRNRWRAAFPLLALATLVKFVCVLLVPAFILYALLTTPRERWRSLIEPLGISAVLALILYAPFWRGQVTFSTLRYQASQFTDSPSALLLNMLSGVTRSGNAEVITKSLGFAAFAIAYIYIARRLYLRRAVLSPDDLAGTAFAVMFAYLMLAVFWFQPWYLLWLISLGALTVGVRARLTLLFSMTGLFTHTATSIAALRGWYYIDPWKEIAIVVCTVFLLPALYITATFIWRSRLGDRMRRRLGGVSIPGSGSMSTGPSGGKAPVI
ncbi:MAG: glycosyltransferase family 39 protein, partial [Dehalococcoidia bacterium]